MFSVQQKRDIANSVQQILRDTGHPELPITEIEFILHVHGRFQWSWADIQNNVVVPVPSVNPWNEAQDCTKACGDCSKYPDCIHKPEPKPLAQYFGEYIEHEVEIGNIDPSASILYAYNSWRELLEQAFDAYESTEGVKIRIEKI